MWLTQLATASRLRVEQTALSDFVEICRTSTVRADASLEYLQTNISFVALLARHGLAANPVVHSTRVARSGTDEGLHILEFVILRGCIARLLRQAELVNWLARHEPGHLRTLQGLLEVELRPLANDHP